MIFHCTSNFIGTVMSAITYLVMVSFYMLFLFPKNVMTHTSVHQTVGESGCRWSNLSIVEERLHHIHLFAADIDTCLHNYLELQSSCNRYNVTIPVKDIYFTAVTYIWFQISLSFLKRKMLFFVWKILLKYFLYNLICSGKCNYLKMSHTHKSAPILKAPSHSMSSRALLSSPSSGKNSGTFTLYETCLDNLGWHSNTLWPLDEKYAAIDEGHIFSSTKLNTQITVGQTVLLTF